MTEPRTEADARLEAFLDDLYQRGIDTAPELHDALKRAGYRIVVAEAADPPGIDVNYQALAAAYDTGYNDGRAGRSRCRTKSYRIMSERDR